MSATPFLVHSEELMDADSGRGDMLVYAEVDFKSLEAENAELKSALRWFSSDNTGISSKAIARTMLGIPDDGNVPWAGYNTSPSDAPDFGRCYRLLKAIPAWRARLPEVAARYPDCKEWTRLVDRWSELEAEYERYLGPDGTIPFESGYYTPVTRLMKRIMEGKK